MLGSNSQLSRFLPMSGFLQPACWTERPPPRASKIIRIMILIIILIVVIVIVVIIAIIIIIVVIVIIVIIVIIVVIALVARGVQELFLDVAFRSSSRRLGFWSRLSVLISFRISSELVLRHYTHN